MESGLTLSSFRYNMQKVWPYLLLFIIAFFVVYPIILLLIFSFVISQIGLETEWGLQNWISVFQEGQIRNALIHTVTLTLARQSIAFLIGLPIAWLVARTNLPGRNWLEFGFWVSFFLPILPVTMGWVLFMDGNSGLLNQWLMMLPFIDEPVFEIFSWWGIVFAHLVGGTIAAKVMLLTPAFRNMDSTLDEAAYVSGASHFQTFFRIVLPIMSPAILMVVLLTTIKALEGFEVELFLGGSAGIEVYSTIIYRYINSPLPQHGIATVLSILVLIVLLPFVFLHQWLSKKGSHATVTGKYRMVAKDLGKWKWPLFIVIFLLLIFATFIPIVLTMLGSVMRLFGYLSISNPFTLDHWRSAFSNSLFLSSLSNTLIIGLSATLAGILVFSLIAYISIKSKFKARSMMDFLTWMPTIIPGIVLSLGIFWVFLQTPLLNVFYGGYFILICAILLGSITLGTQIIKTSMVQLGNELEEAGWSCGASWAYTYFRIILPLTGPAIAVAGVYIFAAAARSASLVALIQTADTKPLSMLQLDFLGAGLYEPASVIGVIILFLTIGVALVARLVGLNIGSKSGW